jgi:hypothetical protein
LKIPEAVSGSESAVRPCVDPYNAFHLPTDAMASMSKEELLKLLGFPGYFEPKQPTVPRGQQMLASNPQPVNAIVIVDEEFRGFLAFLLGVPPEWIPWELVYASGCNVVLSANGGGLLEDFGIYVQPAYATFWYTPNDKNFQELLYMIDDVDPTGVPGCDIMILLTGQWDWDRLGCAWYVGGEGGGRHSVVGVGILSFPLSNLVQHEISHNFGPWNMDHGLDPLYLCIMSYVYEPFYRDYCVVCTVYINENRFRFD